MILLPISAWEGTRLHDDVVFHKENKAIVAALRNDLPQGATLMARGYTPASLLSYSAGEYWPVFGEGSYHARQDDILADFTRYAGHPIRLFDRNPVQVADIAPFFESVSTGSFEVAGVTYWYADGTNFNYPVYRERILKTIAERYYRIPSLLPVYACQFLQRYDFPGGR